MTLTVLLNDWVTTFVLVAARLTGLVISAPVLGSAYVPKMLKVAMVFLFAVALVTTVPAVSVQGLALGLGVVFQLLIGLAIGLVLALYLSIFGMAGQMITYEMGVGLAVAANPGLLSAGSFLSEWQTLLATFIFVAGGGLELTMTALHASFVALPLTHEAISGNAIMFIVGLFQSALMTALLIAAPLFLCSLVVDMVIGVVSRAFPQLNAYFLSLPINFGISIVVILGMLPLLMTVVPNIWHTAFYDISRWLAILEGH
ncbi:MAG: flagellar biosynthetic protein FliR [Firmicutes bacterium]|jgi:flagellar biosynthetic protein FliR|nr:flagellar biosynthetic protein FliR [Bacillota bacterium]MCL5065654.1 flagellar biosynthetic protein FliR [Bacillota bacterium]